VPISTAVTGATELTTRVGEQTREVCLVTGTNLPDVSPLDSLFISLTLFQGLSGFHREVGKHSCEGSKRDRGDVAEDVVG
jgi:hypothetical protein